MSENERDVLGLATCQWGVITRHQAVERGLSPTTVSRRVRDGRWEIVHPRVYRIAGHPVSFRQRCMAAVLWAGDDAVISGVTAGRLWGLDDVTSSHVEVTVPRSRTRTPIAGVSVTATRHLDRLDIAERDRLPVTSLARTVVDLARCLGPDSLEVALDAALRGGRTSTTAILHRAKVVAPSGRAGVGVLRELLAERRGGKAVSGSALETRVRRLFINAGLPVPVSQHRIHDRGRHVARADFAYPELKLVIEVKGYRWRSGRAAWLRDAVRDSEMAARGWRVITITWDEVCSSPGEAIGRVRRALGSNAA